MLKTKLLLHQQQTLEFAIEKKFYGDLSGLGTGKSLSAIAVIDKLQLPTVMVAPPYLVSNLLNEFKKHSDIKAVPHFLKRDPTALVHIVPYTQLAKCDEIFKYARVVFSDEAHWAKNLQAKRTQLFHTLMYKYKPEYFCYMSGTPLRNRLVDIYSFLLLLAQAPHVTPKITDKYKSLYTFANRFTNVTTTKFGISYSGMKNVDELRTYLKPWTIKHTGDVLNLPELIESEVVVSYGDDPELQKAFSQFTEGRVTGEITAKVQSASTKAKFTANYVSEALEAEEGPIVVFSDHRKPLDIIELELSNYRVRQITGDTSMQKRAEYVEMLNKKQLDVLLLTYGAGSSGINLTASNLMVLSDLPWNVSDYEQAKKRSHRMGQDRKCRIVNVIGSKVDSIILKSLQSKSKVIQGVLK
jgi:hypothetical protein